MKSSELGSSTSAAEVTNISAHGIWLLIGTKEYFLPYERFPWFKETRVSEILDLQLLHESHLHWPALDVDLEVACIANPEQYRLTYS